MTCWGVLIDLHTTVTMGPWPPLCVKKWWHGQFSKSPSRWTKSWYVFCTIPSVSLSLQWQRNKGQMVSLSEILPDVAFLRYAPMFVGTGCTTIYPSQVTVSHWGNISSDWIPPSLHFYCCFWWATGAKPYSILKKRQRAMWKTPVPITVSDAGSFTTKARWWWTIRSRPWSHIWDLLTLNVWRQSQLLFFFCTCSHDAILSGCSDPSPCLAKTPLILIYWYKRPWNLATPEATSRSNGTTILTRKTSDLIFCKPTVVWGGHWVKNCLKVEFPNCECNRFFHLWVTEFSLGPKMGQYKVATGRMAVGYIALMTLDIRCDHSIPGEHQWTEWCGGVGGHRGRGVITQHLCCCPTNLWTHWSLIYHLRCVHSICIVKFSLNFSVSVPFVLPTLRKLIYGCIG